MPKYTFSAPCLLGIEGLVGNELRFLGAEEVSPENGRVIFKGDFEMMARANICSRYAERIQILMGEFEALSFEELFQGVKALPWEKFISKTDAFPVKGRSLSSKLHSIPDCQKIIKKAVVERLKEKYMLPWFEETGAVHQIQFLILKDRVSVMIDTSGAGLHKRGYREKANDAPIKETLAAALAEISGVRKNHVVADPMCGSGTILIEAALKAKNIAPGINRYFAAEKWSQIPSYIWKEERKRAKESEREDCTFRGYGYDIDREALKTALENAQKADVADMIKFEYGDVRKFRCPEERCTVITNPPYGERLLDLKSAEELYKVLGENYKHTPDIRYTVISPDDDFEKCFGRKADKRRKLYNGMIKCQVYMYGVKKK